MAREIVIWCDPCMDEDVRTPAVEHSVGLAIGAVKVVPTKTIAMCPNHTDERLKPLEALLAEYGVAIELPQQGGGKKKSSGTKRLPASGHGPQSEQTVLALEQSGVRKGKPPAGPRGNECLWCPLSYSNDGGGFGRHLKVAHGFDGFKEAFGGPCPVCGEGPYDLMLSHCKKAHPEMGFMTVTQPFTWARDNGDPHGIYAAKLEQKGSLDPHEEWARLRESERKSPSNHVGDEELPEPEEEEPPARAAAKRKPAARKK